MYNIKEMIKDLEELKGANVRVFGQPTTLDSEVDDLTIDTVDVLKALADYELTELIEYVEDEDFDLFDECDDIDELLNAMVEYGYIKDVCDYKGDNSYNWNSPLNHDINFNIYENMYGGVFIVLKCHRYGDVRGNYTDEVILSFDSADEFLYLLLEECSKYIEVEVDGVLYDCTIEPTSELISVWCNDTDAQFEVCACDMEDLTEEIRKNVA